MQRKAAVFPRHLAGRRAKLEKICFYPVIEHEILYYNPPEKPISKFLPNASFDSHFLKYLPSAGLKLEA